MDIDKISRQGLQAKINRMREEISEYSKDQDQDVSQDEKKYKNNYKSGPKNNNFFEKAKNVKKQNGIYLVESKKKPKDENYDKQELISKIEQMKMEISSFQAPKKTQQTSDDEEDSYDDEEEESSEYSSSQPETVVHKKVPRLPNIANIMPNRMPPPPQADDPTSVALWNQFLVNQQIQQQQIQQILQFQQIQQQNQSLQHNTSFLPTNSILNTQGSVSHRSSVMHPDNSKKIQKLESIIKEKEEKAKWYEDALQKRFDQMEQFEEKADALELKCSQLEAKLEKSEHNLKIQTNQKEKLQEKIKEMEKEMMDEKKQMEKPNVVEPSEDMKKTIDSKIQENFTLKDIIDQLRKEIDKFKKKLQSQEDMYVNKCLEIDQLNEEIKNQKLKFQNQQRQDQQNTQQIIAQKQQIKLLEEQLRKNNGNRSPRPSKNVNYDLGTFGGQASDSEQLIPTRGEKHHQDFPVEEEKVNFYQEKAKGLPSKNPIQAYKLPPSFFQDEHSPTRRQDTIQSIAWLGGGPEPGSKTRPYVGNRHKSQFGN